MPQAYCTVLPKFCLATVYILRGLFATKSSSIFIFRAFSAVFSHKKPCQRLQGAALWCIIAKMEDEAEAAL